MNFFSYLKDQYIKVIYFIILIIIVNLILISSTPMSKSIYDILYMDILIFVLSLLFFTYEYMKCKSNYKELKNAVDKQQDIDFLLPQTDTFYSQLIRDIVNLKNKEMYNKNKELKTLLEDINDYITKWVHEIKIPITVCELIADRAAQDNISVEISKDIKEQVERIKFLIDQVLYTSRASSYSEDLLMNEISLERVVKDVIKKNAYVFISKKIDLQLGNLNFSVTTDKKWISYIINQILNNACKYVGDDGKISIYACEDKNLVKLYIKDNGIGILPKDIKRVFDKGFTGDNGRQTSKSTGMGLYLSKKMAVKLNHDIEVSSKIGKYTEFAINFYKLSDYFKVTKM